MNRNDHADLVQDMCRDIITDILTKYTAHYNKLSQTSKGVKPPVFTDAQKAALARSLATSLQNAGVEDHRDIERKFHDGIAFNVGCALGVPVGFVNGLLSNIPGYSSFLAGLSYGHAKGFSIEQRCQAWSTAKVSNMFANAPWRKAPEADKNQTQLPASTQEEEPGVRLAGAAV